MKSLRIRLVGSLFLISLFTAVANTVYNSVFYTRDWAVTRAALPMAVGASLTIILAICLILYVYLRPLASVLARLEAGTDVSLDERLHARQRISRIPALLIGANLAGYFIGPLFGLISLTLSGAIHNSAAGNVLQVMVYLAFGLICTVQVLVSFDSILAAPIELLHIRDKDSLRPELSVSSKIVLAAGSGVFLAFSCLALCCVSAAENIELRGQGLSVPILIRDISIICAFATAWTLFLALSLAKGLRQQASHLSVLMAELASGRGNLGSRVAILHRDEFGDIAVGFNALIDTLAGILERIRASAEVVGSSTSRLAESAEGAKGSVAALEGSVGKVGKATGRQGELVRDTNKGIRSLNSSIGEVGAQVHIQAGFVEESSAAVAQMAASIQSVSTLTQKADALASRLRGVCSEGDGAIRATAQSISGMAEAARSVSSFLTEIQKIASQTNLLAMNAAIEAAHAGEAGKGFAVVADEVRSLAESSSRSSKEIAILIKEMDKRIGEGVSLGSQAGQAFGAIAAGVEDTAGLVRTISEAMGEQKIGADGILSSIQELVEATEKIKGLAREQEDESARMKAAMEGIVEASGEIDGAVREETEGNRHIARVVSTVGQEVQRSKEAVAALEEMVLQFKL